MNDTASDTVNMVSIQERNELHSEPYSRKYIENRKK
jgi:hypothetical protein